MYLMSRPLCRMSDNGELGDLPRLIVESSKHLNLEPVAR
jgi:hypothetical protein